MCAASAALHCVGASLRYGGAWGVTAVVYAVGRTAEGPRQIVWRMAFYLEGKTSVGTNDLSPKEATQMSYDVKYIGMDVHKEAIVIAVQNESGKLVMESVIETKASSILQLLHGLRGELHVTWEEGTWAATQTLLAALEIATCKVVAHVRDRRTTVDFLSLMDDVVKSYPLGELHVVLDNLNIHKNEAAKQWLLRHPRVHFHYTPTHASWMNMIECFFSILTRQSLTQ